MKLTRVLPADRCGVWLLRVFHTYSKSKRFSRVGGFVRASVRATNPLMFFFKKKKYKCLFLRGNAGDGRFDGTTLRAAANSVLMLKKRLTPRGSRVYGPISKKIWRKRARASFAVVI